MPESEPTVFVVDDESAVRDGLTCLLEAEGLVVRTHESAEAFLAAYQPGQPGCLLLDVRMRGMSGLQLQARLVQVEPAIPIIIITGHGDIPMAVQALSAGALDFLEKPVNAERLVERVRFALGVDERQRAQWQQHQAFAMRRSSLTSREREVMELMVKCLPSKQIAAKLGITQKTVEVHRKHVLDKMGVRSTPSLVRIVTAAGLSI
jgi:two-component system, LuxR family, response regulator FixJ